jgi:hypothetical protein
MRKASHAKIDGDLAPSGKGDPRGLKAETRAEDAGLHRGLSNDYLNHYSEALMLIEMAADDPAITADLVDWRPVDYRTYFGASELRRASAALAAYDALPANRREAFERLVAAMDTLTDLAIFALQPPCDPSRSPEIALVIAETAPALRKLIDRAAIFLNSGGQELAPGNDNEQAQSAIDRILEQAPPRG